MTVEGNPPGVLVYVREVRVTNEFRYRQTVIELTAVLMDSQLLHDERVSDHQILTDLIHKSGNGLWLTYPPSILPPSLIQQIPKPKFPSRGIILEE